MFLHHLRLSFDGDANLRQTDPVTIFAPAMLLDITSRMHDFPTVEYLRCFVTGKPHRWLYWQAYGDKLWQEIQTLWPSLKHELEKKRKMRNEAERVKRARRKGKFPSQVYTVLSQGLTCVKNSNCRYHLASRRIEWESVLLNRRQIVTRKMPHDRASVQRPRPALVHPRINPRTNPQNPHTRRTSASSACVHGHDPSIDHLLDSLLQIHR